MGTLTPFCHSPCPQSLLHAAPPERPNRSALGSRSRLLPSRQHTAVRANSSSLTHSVALPTLGSRGAASPFSTATAPPAAALCAFPLNPGQTLVNASADLYGTARSPFVRRNRSRGASLRPMSQPISILEVLDSHSGSTAVLGTDIGAHAAARHVAQQPVYGNPGTAPLPPMPPLSSWASERLMQQPQAPGPSYGAAVRQPDAVESALLYQFSPAGVAHIAQQQQQQQQQDAGGARTGLEAPGHASALSAGPEETLSNLPSVGTCASIGGPDEASGPPPGFEDVSDEFATCGGPGAGSFAFADPRTSAQAAACGARNGSGDGGGSDGGDGPALAMVSPQRGPLQLPLPPPLPLLPLPPLPVLSPSPRDRSPRPRSLRNAASQQLLIIPEALALVTEDTHYLADSHTFTGAYNNLSQRGRGETRGSSRGGGGSGNYPTGRDAVAAAVAQQHQQQPTTQRRAGSPYQAPWLAGQEATWGAVTSGSASVASASAAYHLSPLDSTGRSQTNPLRDHFHVPRSTSTQHGGAPLGHAPGEEGTLPCANVQDITLQVEDGGALPGADARDITLEVELDSGDGGGRLDETMGSLLESALSTIAHTSPQAPSGAVTLARVSTGPGMFGDGGWPAERAEGDDNGGQRMGSTGRLLPRVTHGPSMALPMPPASPAQQQGPQQQQEQAQLQPRWQQREWERARSQPHEVVQRQRPRHNHPQQQSQPLQQSLLARVVAAGRSHPGERTVSGASGGSPGGGGGSSGSGGRVRRGVRSAARLFSAAVASVGGGGGGRDSIRRASTSSCSHSAATRVLNATLPVASASIGAAAIPAGTTDAEGRRKAMSRVIPLDTSSGSDGNAAVTSGGGTDPGAATETRRRKHGRERSSSNGGGAAGIIARSLTAAAARRAVSIRSNVQPGGGAAAAAKHRPASGSINGGVLGGVSVRRATVGTGLMSLLQPSASLSGRGGRWAPSGQPSVGQLLMQVVTGGGGIGSQHGLALLASGE